MKKINKSLPPDSFTEFVNTNPNATWDDFRNNARQLYDDLKQQMLAEQGGLCAYCEKNLPSDDKSQQQIEHFHDKSDKSTMHNWGLDWNNLLLVCKGGQTDNYPRPENLSCDAHKSHLKNENKISESCEGLFLNPIQIKTIARLFDFDKATGKLVVNCAACQELANDNLPNHYGDDWCMLAQETIRILNLNCQRLCDDRLEVLKFYNQKVAFHRKQNDKLGFQKISDSVFRKPFPAFFTTWRSLLGKHAEEYLASIGYNG